MADEYVVLDRDAFANKAMAGDFAIFSNPYVLLDFDKSPDFRVFPDVAAVKVDELRQFDAAGQFHVWSNRAEFMQGVNCLSSLCSGTIGGLRVIGPVERFLASKTVLSRGTYRHTLGQATAIKPSKLRCALGKSLEADNSVAEGAAKKSANETGNQYARVGWF